MRKQLILKFRKGKKKGYIAYVSETGNEINPDLKQSYQRNDPTARIVICDAEVLPGKYYLCTLERMLSRKGWIVKELKLITDTVVSFEEADLVGSKVLRINLKNSLRDFTLELERQKGDLKRFNIQEVLKSIEFPIPAHYRTMIEERVSKF